MKALEAQGRSREDLPYKAPFQPYGSWFALFATGFITFFKGFDTFIPFKPDTFVTSVFLGGASAISLTEQNTTHRSYVGIPIFLVLWIVYKIKYKTKMIPPDQVDLVTGLREIDEEEERYLAVQKARGPQTRLQRLWDSM